MAVTVSSRRGVAGGGGLGCREAGPERALQLWRLACAASVLPPRLGAGELKGPEPRCAPARVKGRVNSGRGSGAEWGLQRPDRRGRGGGARCSVMVADGGESR